MSSVVCHRFSLGEIEDATKNFEKILGDGGEGTVYLGHIPAIGTVAVKRLKSNFIEFEEEIEIVSMIKHPHLVSLLGYCEESGQKILVYEYMGKGSLSNYITKKSRSTAFCLSWQQRLNICLGAARGLQHLHKETEELPKGIIHRDIKPDNILLDDNWVAKVSDFGLCKLSHAGQNKSTMVTMLKGTGGYYAPEYVQYGSITRKLDVYAFGVVLFEVLCHKMPWDRGNESYYRLEDEDLGLWARENVDPEINEEISEDCLEAFTHIIGRSLQINPSIRPTMDDVVMDLECALKCQDCQDEGTRRKAPTSGGRKVSIPGSMQKMILNIKEITRNSEDEIYATLKECSMDPFQTIQKLLIKVRKSNETTTELPESSTTVALDNVRDINMERKVMQAKPVRDSDLLSKEGPNCSYQSGDKKDSMSNLKLGVEVQSAHNLLPKDGNGSSNPYVELHFDHQKFRTTIKEEDLNPYWNETFLFNISDPNNLYNLTLDAHVYNSIKGSNSRSFLGKVHINGTMFVPYSDAVVLHYPLEKRNIFSRVSGQLGLKVFITDNPTIKSSNPFPEMEPSYNTTSRSTQG